MDTSFFFRGLLIGFSIAAVVGPIGLLCIHRTLHEGFLSGLVTGLGAATADAVYGSIAAFGLTVITTFLVRQAMWIHLIGGLFLVYLGIKTLLTRPAERAADARANHLPGAYTSTLLLTLTNPTTILSFIAVFAGLGVGGNKNSVLSATVVVAGVFLGSVLWWCLLSGGINLLREKFATRWLLWINRISGGGIALFGIVAIISLIR
ncbi:MAG TPA: LysE family transporter [Ktedonobacteraceae bacterium]|nr:LysE family transporter [Ktedonobacteraceae bacterium]